MEHRRAQRCPRQDFEWEDHLFHIIDVVQKKVWSAMKRFSYEGIDDQACEKLHTEFGRTTHGRSVACSKDAVEHQRIHGQHDQRMDEGPQHSDDGSSIATDHLASGKLPNQVAMLGEAVQYH